MTETAEIDTSSITLRLGVVVFACGLAVFLPETYSPKTPDSVEVPLRLTICAAFLLAAAFGWCRAGATAFSPVYFACFVAAAAQFVDWRFSNWLPPLLGIELRSPAGFAVAKFESTALLVATVLALTLASGDRLDSLYLRRGKLRPTLVLGLATFGFFALTSTFVAETLFGGQSITLGRLGQWAPWIVIFVFSNGFMEELLFRGLFLPRLSPVFGHTRSNVIIAVWFTLWHWEVQYAVSVLPFLVIVFCLGLGLGATVKRTENLWAAAMFHAGVDIPVVLGLFSNLP